MLLKLSDHGLVVSTKGKGGGNRLARSAEKINLEDVYVAVKDRPLFGSFDKQPFKDCKVSCNIGKVLTDIYCELEGDLRKNMKKVKLAKIMKELT